MVGALSGRRQSNWRADERAGRLGGDSRQRHTMPGVIASCFEFDGRRNKVVYSDLNFPSVMYFWEAQRLRGARVHMVKTDDGIAVPTERLLDAIDEETLLVPISHVIFRSSYINDAKAVCKRLTRSARG